MSAALQEEPVAADLAGALRPEVIDSAARVKVPASATAARYRRCHSSRPCGACASARDSRTGSACACFMSVTRTRPWWAGWTGRSRAGRR